MWKFISAKHTHGSLPVVRFWKCWTIQDGMGRAVRCLLSPQDGNFSPWSSFSPYFLLPHLCCGFSLHVDAFYVLSLGALCLFLVMLRCWLIHPDLAPCLFLGRQNLAGTFDGGKDAPGAITHQLLISSKFPFS